MDFLTHAENWLEAHTEGEFDQNTIEEVKAAALVAVAQELRQIRQLLEKDQQDR